MSKTLRVRLIVVVSMVLVLAHVRLGANPGYVRKGLASWYGQAFEGRPTASGTRFSLQEMTAAHRTLPLGTKVMVENLKTGDRVEVKINDRGPYADPQRRIIDLSHAAADSLGLVERGVAPVRVAVTEPAPTTPETVYEIQVGAFQEYAEAEQVLRQVRHPAAYMTLRNGPYGRYYRVRIGPFATVEKAEKVAKALKRQGYRIFLDEVPDTAVLNARQPHRETGLHHSERGLPQPFERM
jgi:rare lipoprotein A